MQSGSSGTNILTGNVRSGVIDDFIFAGSGNDAVAGMSGNDTLWGQSGNDIIQGNHGSDKLFGGDGNDSLLGGTGAEPVHPCACSLCCMPSDPMLNEHAACRMPHGMLQARETPRLGQLAQRS